MSSKEDPEFNKVTQRWEYEDETGQSFELDNETQQWIPIFDEAQVKAQQEAYSVPGVDETAPAVEPTKKRKIQEVYTGGSEDPETHEQSSKAKNRKDKASDANKKPKETSVYVQNLPSDTTVDELAALFSKCGLIQEDPVTSQPRIRIYTDSEGNQKGDALVIYFREESVSLAIQMLDDTSLRGDSRMLTVSKATFNHKQSKPGDTKNPKPKDETIKKKGSRKVGKLKSKLADWDDEDVVEVPRTNKYAKVVILKGMFSLDELESEPALLLDLKEDVRDECARLGDVTNVVLYDKEPDGIMSVRFKQEEDAMECLKLMNGRYFGGRQVVAELYDGKRTYLKTGKNAGEEDGGEDEETRLEKFGAWLEGEE